MIKIATLCNPIYSKTFTISFIICMCLLTSCDQDVLPEQVRVVRPAKLFEVSVTSNIKNYTFPAIIEAATSKDLTFQVTGQIETLAVKEGQKINKGDVIATLDQRRFKNDVQSAQTQYDLAKQDFDRAKRLIAEDAIAKNIYDQRRSQLEVAAVQLDTAKKSLEDTILISPFDGLVAKKSAKVLDAVTSSQPVITLQTTGSAEAIVKIPSNLVSARKKIEPIETVVVLDSAPEHIMVAKQIEATPIADQSSQTFEVRFSFTPPESLTVLPGMTGVIKAKFILNSDTQNTMQISVPLSSVQNDSEGQYVWLVDLDAMTVTRRRITVGLGVGENLTVTSGLSVGDTIVEAGALYLHEGMEIRRL